MKMNTVRHRVVVATVAAVVVIGVAATAVVVSIQPPSQPPSYTSAPDIAADGYVSHTETMTVDVPLDFYAKWAETVDLSELLKGDGNFPSVARTEPLWGDWNRPGAARRVVLSDGHYAAEKVLVNEPARFRYQVWGYTNFAKLAVDYAVGEFVYEPLDGQTKVTWTYSFHKRPLTGDAFLPGFVSGDWASYMRTSNEAMKAGAEQAYRTR